MDDKSAWLTTEDLQHALAGRRGNDVKVQIRGITVPLSEIYYSRIADTWILVPYNGEDLKTALADCPED